MKQILTFLLAAVMVVGLCACGSTEEDSLFQEVSSVDEVSQQLGYRMLELESKADAITWSSAAVCGASAEGANDAVGLLTYVSGKSTIELRMTMDESKSVGLAGLENAGYAGAVDAPSDAFGTLGIYVLHSDLFYSEFSFTSGGYTCYLSLSKSKTDESGFSKLLIDFANQLYNMKDVPDFAMQEKHRAEAEAAKKAAEEAQQQAEAAAQQKDDKPSEGGTTEAPTTEQQPEEQPEVQEPEQQPEQTTGGDLNLTLGGKSYDGNDFTLVHVGEGYTFEVSGGDGNYTWSSSDIAVATVSEGKVVATGVGVCTITCVSGNGHSVTATIRVNQP